MSLQIHCSEFVRGGILGRFENVRVKKSAKKTVTCDAVISAYCNSVGVSILGYVNLKQIYIGM